MEALPRSSMIKIILLACLFSLADSAFAKNFLSSLNQGDPYFSLCGGVNWERSGQTTSVNFGGLDTNLYQPQRSYQTGPIWGVEGGRQWLFTQNAWVSLGLQAGYTQAVNMAGTVRPLYYLNPGFDTLNYTYSIRSIPLLVVGQLGYTLRNKWQPYVIGGLGVSLNRASDYNEIPTNSGNTAMAMRSMFGDYTNTAFAYTLGLGISYLLIPSTSVGVEYRFASYGSGSFSQNNGSTTGLNLGQIYSNNLFARLTVNFK